MKYGSIEYPKEIDNLWEVVYDSGELVSNTASLTISNLDGNADVEYRLIARTVHNNASIIRMRFNNDSGANYGSQTMFGENTTILGGRNTTQTSVEVTQGNGVSGPYSFAEHIIYAKSGQERTVISLEMTQTATTTVDKIKQTSHSWSNTADNITSIVLSGSVGNDMAAGSRYILLKRTELTSGVKTGLITPQSSIYGVWQKIYEEDVTTAKTSTVISSLTGNTDVLYRLIIRPKNDNAGTAQISFQLNNDGGANYGMQYLAGSSTTVSAVRSTTETNILPNSLATGEVALFDILIYAKSGYERTVLVNVCGRTTGTTVTNASIRGFVWNNTADQITSIDIDSNVANGLGVGTHIELWRLNL